MFLLNSKAKLSSAATLTLLLMACGGGGSDSTVNLPPEPDTIPEQFNFVDVTSQSTDSEIVSEPIIVTGIDSPSPISIEGGEYSINGAAFTADSGIVKNNDEVVVKLLSANAHMASSTATLNIGNITDQFSVETHDEYTRLASDLEDKESDKFAIVTQPLKGQVIVSADLTTAKFYPLNAFNYLDEGETEQVTVEVSLLGSSEKHNLTFTASGKAQVSECDAENSLIINASDIPQSYTKVTVEQCVSLDASPHPAGQWVAWLGDNGAQRPTLITEIGLNTANNKISFKPPVTGKYNLGWCPDMGACHANYYFESIQPSSKKLLSKSINVKERSADEPILIMVEHTDENLSEQQSYHWVIHHWNNEYKTLIDVVTLSDSIELPAIDHDNNYHVSLVVDDNVFQAEGSFTRTAQERLGKITTRFNTHGNYKLLSTDINIRPDSSTLAPPKIVTVIEGNETRFIGGNDEPYIINATKDSQIVFDMNESTDENQDQLTYTINQVAVDSTSGQYTLLVTRSTEVSVCVSDGFPWSYQESPCAYFDIVLPE